MSSIILVLMAFISSLLAYFADYKFAFISSICLLLLSHCLFFRDKKLASTFNLLTISFWGMNLIHLLNVDEASVNYLFMSLVSMSIFYFVYMIFQLGSKGYSTDIDHYSVLVSMVKINKLNVLSISAFISVGVALRIYDIGVSNVISLSYSRVDVKDSGGLLSLVSNYIMIASIPFYFLIPLIKLFNKKYYLFTLFVSILSVVITFFVLRTRSVVIASIISFVFGWVYTYLYTKKGCATKIPLSMIVKIAIVLLIIIISSSVMRVARGLMEVGVGELSILSSVENSLVNGDMNYGKNIDEIMEEFEQQRVSLNGQSYYRLLFTPIPRTVWSDKPENTQQVVADIMGKNYANFTLPPGIQGDAFINFGLWGVGIFIFYAIIFSSLDRINNPYSLVFLSSLFLPLFHLSRGGFTNPIIMIIVIAISTKVLSYVYFRGKHFG